MSNRTAAKALGLLLLVPSVALGALPLLAAYTDVLDNFGNFAIGIGPLVLAEVSQTASGASATSLPWLWVAAGAGELILIGLQVFAPVRKNRYRLTIR